MEEIYTDIVVGAEYTVDCGPGWVGRFIIIADDPDEERFTIKILEGLEELVAKEEDWEDHDEPNQYYIYYESRFQESMEFIEIPPVDVQITIKDLFDEE